MRSSLFALVMAALLPAYASAEGTPQPKYPLSFDCAAVPAGSQRQACNRSQLNPPMGPVLEQARPKPQGIVPSPEPQRLPTAKPPTIPSLPGTIEHRN